MTQKIHDIVRIESPEATVHVSKEADEYLDERGEWDVENIRIRENGWIDIWEEEEGTYARSLPPHVIYRIDWGKLEE
ncbi:hypothetical protein HWV07_09060 [Natronomonas salina]|uniref:hypothetical protein n=1 Tax=Natronomonas salina TaxID=1710540 RepID=UPI0015B58C21|nr:hypothetical protein [Natronomonas salina]QLD89173.1 hypothetical protein HWV07_09060 [Natronomonas salina]